MDVCQSKSEHSIERMVEFAKRAATTVCIFDKVHTVVDLDGLNKRISSQSFFPSLSLFFFCNRH